MSCVLLRCYGTRLVDDMNLSRDFIVSCRCELPFESDNATFDLPEEVKNVSFPWDSFKGTYSSCEIYDTNFTNDYLKGGVPVNKTKHCDKWIFDKSKYQSSSVIEVRLQFYAKFCLLSSLL